MQASSDRSARRALTATVSATVTATVALLALQRPNDAQHCPSPAGPGPAIPGPAAPPPGLPVLPGAPGTPTGWPFEPGLLGGNGPASPGGGFLADELLTPTWRGWWSANGDAFLDLRAHVHRPPYGTSDVLGFRLDPLSAGDLAPYFPTADAVREHHLPALLETFEAGRQEPVRRAYLRALGRASRALPVEDRAEIVALLIDALGSKDALTAETATIALAWTAHADAARALIDVVEVGDAARGWFRSGKVPPTTGLQAILGLGRIANEQHEDVRRFVLARLWRVVETPSAGPPDRRVAALAAIGLAPLPWSAGNDAASQPGCYQHGADRLAQRFLAADEDHEVRAAALISWTQWLMALDERERELEKERFLPMLLGRIDADLDRRLFEAAIVALGNVADADDDPFDRRAVERLLTLDALGAPRAAEERRWMELARIAGRGSAGSGATRERAIAALLGAVVDGMAQERAWAVLALGRLGHELRWRGEDLGDDVRRALRTRLLVKPSADEEAALCLVLGWLRDLESQRHLEARFREAAQLDVRAFAALGLGLLGERSSLGVLRDVQADTILSDESLETAVTLARALLEDRDIGLVRLASLDRSVALEAKLAQLAAIGEVGDVRAVPPLLELAARPRGEGALRAAAVDAAGRVTEPDLLSGPWRYALDTANTAWPLELKRALRSR
ncbi:MAG: hypothetical protein WD226_02160 [Planctomycetota bacterium]